MNKKTRGRGWGPLTSGSGTSPHDQLELGLGLHPPTHPSGTGKLGKAACKERNLTGMCLYASLPAVGVHSHLPLELWGGEAMGEGLRTFREEGEEWDSHIVPL